VLISSTVSRAAKLTPLWPKNYEYWLPIRPTTYVESGHSRHQCVHRRESGRRLSDADLPDELAISVVTLGELRSEVLVAVDVKTRDRRLATLSEALALDPLPVDQPVAEAWALLRVLLRDAGKRMPVNDSWIAATAMSPGYRS
jgi:predicted nucleic acid-binding protein